MWECDGVKYYADELKYMPAHYRFVNEYKTGCTLYVSGLDQRLEEVQAVEGLATCMGRWPARNCGVVGIEFLRKATDESPGRGHVFLGGSLMRLANRQLAQAFVWIMNGVTLRNRTITAEP